MKCFLRLAVTGSPVAHSKSPQIFRRFFSKTGTRGFYTRIASDSIEEAVVTAKLCGITGLNVTAPFKESAAALASDCQEAVRRLGAANTLILEKEGSCGKGVYAANTDYLGVLESVRQVSEKIRGRKGFVAGAGGAGVAAAYALSLAGFDVTVFNRSPGKAAEKTAWIKNCRVEKLSHLEGMAAEADIIVNTLPLETAFFDTGKLKKGACVFEANYRKSSFSETALEQERKSLIRISPLSWLVNQAGFAFNIFSEEASCPQLPEGLFTDIAPPDSIQPETKSNISLIGFMGSGKTTAGKLLSEISKMDFIDIDAEIEKAEKTTIPEIFSSKGENCFRQIEQRITEAVFCREKGKIIACGGGVVKEGKNRDVITENSYPVWLVSEPEISAQRAASGTRPLLEGPGKAEKAFLLFRERIDLYGMTASLIINTAKRGPLETAEKIYEETGLLLRN